MFFENIYFIFYFFAFFLFFVTVHSKQLLFRKVIVVYVVVILVLLNLFRDFDIVQDRRQYETFYSKFVTSGSLALDKYVLIEPSIKLMATVSSFLFGNNYYGLILLYTLLAITIQFFLIEKYSVSPNMSLVVYMSYFLLTQGNIQFRAGVSVAFLLLALFNRAEGKNLRTFLFLIIAVFFHYSAIVGFILLFLNVKQFNKRLYLLIIIVSYLIPVFHLSFGSVLTLIPPNPIVTKILMYRRQDQLAITSMFNLAKISRLIISLFFLFYSSKFINKDKYFNLLLKFYIFSFVVYGFFYDLPVVPGRLSEVFRVSEYFLLPYSIILFKNRNYAYSLIMSYSFIMLLISFLQINLLHFFF